MRETLKFISDYNLFGFLPLDKTLHFFFGMWLTMLLRSYRVRFKIIFSVLIGLELIKETYDSFYLESTLLEHCLDFVVTLLYPIILLGVVELKKRLPKE